MHRHDVSIYLFYVGLMVLSLSMCGEKVKRLTSQVDHMNERLSQASTEIDTLKQDVASKVRVGK